MNHFEHAKKIIKSWVKWKQEIKTTPIKTNLDLMKEAKRK